MTSSRGAAARASAPPASAAGIAEGPGRGTVRRPLTERQAEVVTRLVEAAVEEIHDHGYEGLTVRNVARRAGMAPASAYTYFSSKDHLVAEALWRKLARLPTAAPDDATALERVVAELRALGSFMADDPALSAACTTALLGPGPDVMDLRTRIGHEIHSRLRSALGPGGDRRALQILELAYTGAMLSTGMGHLSFADVADQLTEAAHLVLGEDA
ncbi:MAG TPA: helix-turn-helix domain-containing protein [Acidimicrobiales bacterium]|nr:helix-turn-helix domain-containing protein [Acidimicrobiales bacterium]